MFLAGDIGGTKTLLAIGRAEGGKGTIVRKEKFPSRSFPSLSAVIEKFLRGEKLQCAAFGIAGPVERGECKTTNLPWDVKESEIAAAFSIPRVTLLNDLVANAYGIQTLSFLDLLQVHAGEKREGTRVLISAGTGLGVSTLFYEEGQSIPTASEGGHADFAPRSSLEFDLFLYLQNKFGHVSCERVISGQGLANIYDFLTDTGRAPKNGAVEAAFKTETVRGKVISSFGLEGKDKACLQTLELFVSLYGAEAGNMALRSCAVGGVFLGGGIAPKLVKFIQREELFFRSFCEKGRLAEYLKKIPVSVILNEETALAGALHYCATKRSLRKKAV